MKSISFKQLLVLILIFFFFFGDFFCLKKKINSFIKCVNDFALKKTGKKKI